MKSSSLIFILLIITSFLGYSISKTDKCSDRWQIIDKLKIKITLDWQILPEMNLFVTEFRTNIVIKGFWYGFGVSSSPNRLTEGIVYALRRRDNDAQISWEIYNLTESNVISLGQDDASEIMFQRLLSSGLLTVRRALNLTVSNIDQSCLYFVYMRGRFENKEALFPDEIRFNRSVCLTCQSVQLPSTTSIPITQDLTTDLMMMDQSTSQSIAYPRSSKEDAFISTSLEPLSANYRTEYKFIWFGRIINRAWLDDYFNLSSLSSRNLRLDLQNLFLFLINHNSSFSFICSQFELTSLQSGSILFASNITLISNLSEEQTGNTLDELIKSVKNSTDYNLQFDLSAHHIQRSNQVSYVHILFKNLSRTIGNDYLRQGEVDPALNLLIGSIISIGCLMTMITSVLCLYGYYKCRRRQFRLLLNDKPLNSNMISIPTGG